MDRGCQQNDRTLADGQVTVHAIGRVADTGTQFWSTKDAGQEAFEYRAGIGDVITG